MYNNKPHACKFNHAQAPAAPRIRNIKVPEPGSASFFFPYIENHVVHCSGHEDEHVSVATVVVYIADTELEHGKIPIMHTNNNTQKAHKADKSALILVL